MGKGILLCGCNGCGKSTLGPVLARKLGIRFLDIEDFYFPKADPAYPYREARTREEVTALLAADAAKAEPFVLASCTGNYGPEVEPCFALAVLLTLPGEERAKRVRRRSARRFGERILPGGDLYEAEERFFAMAAAKAPEEVRARAEALGCPVMELDSDRPAEELAEEIIGKLPKGLLEG